MQYHTGIPSEATPRGSGAIRQADTPSLPRPPRGREPMETVSYITNAGGQDWAEYNGTWASQDEATAVAHERSVRLGTSQPLA